MSIATGSVHKKFAAALDDLQAELQCGWSDDGCEYLADQGLIGKACAAGADREEEQHPGAGAGVRLHGGRAG